MDYSPTFDADKSIVTAVVGILIIIILMTASFFIYYKSQPLIPAPIVKNTFHSIELSNKTKLPYTIRLPSTQKLELSPNDSVKVALSNRDTINATSRQFDGSLQNYSYQFLDPSITHLYIGNSGIFSNNSASDETLFINNAPYPVMFVEKSTKGGRRWASDIILPKMKVSNQLVADGSIWQVVHPTDERRPISEITVGRIIPSKIIFDGKRLLSM